MVVGLLASWAPSAGAEPDPPIDRSGPALTVSEDKLDRALECQASVATAQRDPVLLIPGTTLNPGVQFSWNWERALSALGWPRCTLALPDDGMADIQVAGEYVVHAIRAVHDLSGRTVDIVGHSQGGMVPRWALRFWPDTRTMVDDLVGLSPSNHGTVDANAVCLPGCAPAFWQQRRGSDFLGALNSGQETFAGIDYSVVYTRLDEVVVPNLGPAASSKLSGGGGEITNVAVQEVCPLNVSEHLAVGTFDNTAYELAIDALDHPGPADPSRVGSAPCRRLLMPGVNKLTFALDFGRLLTHVARVVATYPHVREEPALKCYATAAGCP